MECAVYNCKNKKSSNIKKICFYRFPKDEKLLNKWKKFCRCDKISKRSIVCHEHFLPEDIHGSKQFEMGFCSRITLRRGAVPCVYKKDTSKAAEQRQERSINRSNKELVSTLLKESIGDTKPVENPLDEIPVSFRLGLAVTVSNDPLDMQNPEDDGDMLDDCTDPNKTDMDVFKDIHS